MVTWLFIAAIVLLMVMLCAVLAGNGAANERREDAEHVIESLYAGWDYAQTDLDVYCRKWGVVIGPDNRIREKGRRRR